MESSEVRAQDFEALTTTCFLKPTGPSARMLASPTFGLAVLPHMAEHCLSGPKEA